MPLIAKAIDATRPHDKPANLSDGAGLYLYIAPTCASNGATPTVAKAKL